MKAAGITTSVVVVVALSLLLVGCSGVQKSGTEQSAGDFLGRSTGIDFINTFPTGDVTKCADARSLSREMGFEVKVPSYTKGEAPRGFVAVKGAVGWPDTYAMLAFPGKFYLLETHTDEPPDFKGSVENFKRLQEDSGFHPDSTVAYLGEVSGHEAEIHPLVYNNFEDGSKEPVPTRVKWFDGELYYELRSVSVDTVTLDDLLRIANSIYAKP